jgi:uncharacterized protein YkwD
MRIRIFPLLTLLACIALGVAASAHADPAAPAGATKVYLPLVTGLPGVQTPEQQQMAGRVLALVNAERARVGCAPLSMDMKLVAAAQGHSTDMAINNFFAHIGSGGSSVSERANAAGYSWGRLGENIAAGQSTPEMVTAGWMASEGHRDNILDCRYVHTGIGFVYQADDRPLGNNSMPFYRYWTQVFAAPN